MSRLNLTRTLPMTDIGRHRYDVIDDPEDRSVIVRQFPLGRGSAVQIRRVSYSDAASCVDALLQSLAWWLADAQDEIAACECRDAKDTP